MQPNIDIDRLPNLKLSSLGKPSDLPATFVDFLSDVRRHLHRHPELGFEEHGTHAFIRDVLEAHGLSVQGPIAGTGLYVDIHGDMPGRTVAFRADIDALPTQDAKRAEYASETPGVAHLCGHDAHSAVAVGTALILHQNREQLRGTVRVLFQPNEEGMPGGADTMIREGIIEGMQAIYTVHVDPTLEVGKYGLLAGPITASTDQFLIRLTSPSTGHSARPHEAVDTVWVATEIMNTLYQLVGRVTDARNPTVLTICRLRGGDAFNVIPSEVEFGGTLRSTSSDDRKAVIRHVQKVASQLASMHGAEADVDIRRGSPPVNNDPSLVEHVESTIRKFSGEEAVYHVPRTSMGAEDFAHYLEHVPGMLLRVGTFSGPETAFPLHDANFDIDERALAPTSALMAHVLSSDWTDGRPGSFSG